MTGGGPRDPEKRALKRAKQRAAGYRGVKKHAGGGISQHNSGRGSDLGEVGPGKLDGTIKPPRRRL